MYTYHNSEERYEKDEYFAKRKNGFFSGNYFSVAGFFLNYIKLNSTRCMVAGNWSPRERNETNQTEVGGCIIIICIVVARIDDKQENEKKERTTRL